VVKFFAPRAYVAEGEFRCRKEKQTTYKKWMDTVNLRQSELLQSQLKMQDMIAKARAKAASGGMGM